MDFPEGWTGYRNVRPTHGHYKPKSRATLLQVAVHIKPLWRPGYRLQGSVCVIVPNFATIGKIVERCGDLSIF